MMPIAQMMCAVGASFSLWLAFQPIGVRPRILFRDTYTGDEVFGIEIWPVAFAGFIVTGLSL